MPSRARSVVLVIVAILALLSLWGVRRIEVVSDIRHFIPTAEDPVLAEVSRALSGSSVARTLVVLVEGDDAVPTVAALARTLREHPDVEWVREGIDDAMRRDVVAIYGERHALLDDRTWSRAALDDAAASLRHDLAGPRGSLVARRAPVDPLGSFDAVIEKLRRGDASTLSTQDGVFVTRDGAAVMFVRTYASPFDVEAQERVRAQLFLSFGALALASDAPLALKQSGLAPFAIAAQRATARDVTRVSIASAVGIVLLFLVLFRRVSAAVMALAPVVLGLGTGVLACSIFFPHVHGLTLAFGSALLGVGVDYAVHAMFHVGLRGRCSIAEVMARVRPGLLLGAGTTVVGIAGLALTSFPGMRELAVFGVVGVATTLGVTLLVVPAFGDRLARPATLLRLVHAADGLRDRIARRPGASAIALTIVLVIAGIGALRVSWAEGLTALYRPDPALVAETDEVRDASGGVDLSRVVLATGDDVESALRRNDAVYDALLAAMEAGEIAGFRSLSPWLPSTARQTQTLRAYQDPQLRQQLDAAFAKAGFRPHAFAEFFTVLQDPPPPLRREDLIGTAIEPIVDPFVIDLHGRVAIVTWIRGEIPRSVDARLRAMPDLIVFDQPAFVDCVYARLRGQMLRLFALGLFAVVGLVALRYRAWRPTLAACIPAVAAVIGALGIVGWTSGTANLLHVAAMLLMASIGVDYGVFLVEHDPRRRDAAITLAAALVAAATTVLSFGLLAASNNPALASIGLAIVVGIGCALLAAPISARLCRRAEAAERPVR